MASYSSIFYQCDNCPVGVVIVTKATLRSGLSMTTYSTSEKCSICDKKFSVPEAQKLVKHKTQPGHEI